MRTITPDKHSSTHLFSSPSGCSLFTGAFRICVSELVHGSYVRLRVCFESRRSSQVHLSSRLSSFTSWMSTESHDYNLMVLCSVCDFTDNSLTKQVKRPNPDFNHLILTLKGKLFFKVQQIFDRDLNPQPRITSPTLYPLGHDCPLQLYSKSSEGLE